MTPPLFISFLKKQEKWSVVASLIGLILHFKMLVKVLKNYKVRKFIISIFETLRKLTFLVECCCNLCCISS